MQKMKWLEFILIHHHNDLSNTQSIIFMLSKDQFKTEAEQLGCETEAVMAVASVESDGNGFRKDGKPVILFEGHIFWRELEKAGIDPAPLQKGNEDILYPKWDLATVRPFYNMDQYKRLDKAKLIDVNAALKSASWGAFQIMGNEYAAAGFNSVSDFVVAQQNEMSQLQGFSNFIKNNPALHKSLQLKDWTGFAKAYNGKGYQANHYDTRLAAAYQKFKSE